MAIDILQPGTPIPNGAGGIVRGQDHCSLCKTAPCDPVIGTDQKVYRNAHCAACVGVQAIANALDRSICVEDTISGIFQWIKDNMIVVIIALAVAILLSGRR
ncbi:MAG: hypothetical protein QXO20_07670 [Candidatus Bathyarchaeia archaeon]